MTYLRHFTAGTGTGTQGAGVQDESPTVVVFPQAGAGCLRLHAVVPVLPPGLDLLGVQLPGREDRLADVPANDLSEAVDCIAAECLADARSPAPARRGPLHLLGVSLGAVIAYEVARKLESQGAAARSLVVAAARSPEHWRTYPAADPPSAEVTALLHPSVRESAFARYAAATMRSDLRLMVGYEAPSTRLTRTSLRSVSGRHDSVATTAHMSGWRNRTTDYRGHQVIDADHHAFMSQDILVGMLTEIASETVSGPAVRA
ncbi:thioesterase II family protein [Streptomyces sp. DH24]|uniref:thioesterase II family protein n=1 Tax=Streptomyces sp. DH24 TaxID=3040123 RepID=UPI0024433774|nr:thioesterase domain-containing protein [Streptomyces sp. DH24]MDG9718401.1 thioesterase domain-containing protein [Streptomyces sp. DH24]